MFSNSTCRGKISLQLKFPCGGGPAVHGLPDTAPSNRGVPREDALVHALRLPSENTVSGFCPSRALLQGWLPIGQPGPGGQLFPSPRSTCPHVQARTMKGPICLLLSQYRELMSFCSSRGTVLLAKKYQAVLKNLSSFSF